MRILLLSIFLSVSIVALGYNEKNVTFQSDTLTLKGTLLTPTGPGPFPVVVFIHGSGPNDRNETFYINQQLSCLYPGLVGKTVRTFKDMAEFLAQNGIATFRYDKRTLTYNQQLDPQKIKLQDFMYDAIAAIQYLEKEHGFSDFILAGHSQGSTFMPEIATRVKHVTGMISLAGPSSSIDTLLAGQVKYIETKCGDSANASNQEQNVLAYFGMVRNGTAPNSMVMGAYPAFWKEWIDLTDSAIIKFDAITLPKLFIQGLNDYNVPEEEGLRFYNHNSGDVYFLPGINHLLTNRNSPLVDENVKDTILYWLQLNNLNIAGFKEKTYFSPRVFHDYKNRQLIITSEKNQISLIALYDFEGRILQNIKLKNSTATEIPMPPAGNYFLKAVDGKGQSFSYKFNIR